MIDALLYFPSRRFDDAPARHGLAHEDALLRTADGESLHGWWFAARAAPRLGHLVHFHGNAGNISHRLAEAVALTAAGFDVLLFDYRGYGRSTGRPHEEGLYRDARAAVDWVARRPGVDPSRAFYLGESLGGAVALELALERPPRGLVLQSTFTGLRDMAREHYPLVPAFLVPDGYPSLRRIAQLRAPLLVIHGGRDEIVPFVHGQRLFAAAPEPKRFHPVTGAGHNDLLAVMGARPYASLVAAWAASIR
ncbi:MAG TPA: alpha/beta hydrolase [Vicinamibacteria bacterium]|nr:alpha/beta hydrolase [Vicinamibacteria bacterium]